MTRNAETLLLVQPVPMCRIGNRRHVESQAVNGLLRWADNFASVTAAILCYPAEVAERLPGIRWECIDGRLDFERITVIELPYAYKPALHFRFVRNVRKVLRPLIARSRYLCFGIGGYFGDWGSVAALIASEQRREFAVWTDRVESRVIRHDATKKSSWLSRAYGIAFSWLVHVYERRIIKRATLGLFHGRDTFNVYQQYVRLRNTHAPAPEPRAFLVHDIHMRAEDRLSGPSAAEKLRLLGANAPYLHVGYAGRAAEMKAPIDWLRVIVSVKNRGVPIRATWLGDGPLLEAMSEFINKHALEQIVELPGFVSKRAEVVAAIRRWDVLLFTHVTPESPRILLEAMASATPLVGYDSAYARDLVATFGEHYLSCIGDIEGLADRLEALYRNRSTLQALAKATYDHSEGFNDVAVFGHRSDLIRRFLA